VLVAHICNPSYSGGRDQEDQGLKPAQANSSARPYFKKTHHKKGLVKWLKVKALSSNPSTTTTKISLFVFFLTVLDFTEKWSRW
jgi:hypothetical protein